MDSLSTKDNAPFCWVSRQENHPTTQCPFISGYRRKRFRKLWDSNYEAYVTHNYRNNDRRGRERNKSNHKSHRGRSSQDRKISVNERERSAGANPNARGDTTKSRGWCRTSPEKTSATVFRRRKVGIVERGSYTGRWIERRSTNREFRKRREYAIQSSMF